MRAYLYRKRRHLTITKKAASAKRTVCFTQFKSKVLSTCGQGGIVRRVLIRRHCQRFRNNMSYDEDDDGLTYSDLDIDLGLASPTSSDGAGAADQLCQYAGYDYDGKVPIASEEVAALSKERLWTGYVSKRRPAIINGLLRDEQFNGTKWVSED